MRSEEILDALAELDAAFPTHRWTIDGINVLPLFRYEVYNNNHALYRRSPGERRADKLEAPKRVGRALRSKAAAALRLGRARWSDRAASAPISRADALLFSDGVSFSLLHGRYYDRFCDPIREQLERRGLRTLLATPLEGYAVPRHSPSLFVQPALDRAKIRGLFESRLRRPAIELPEYERACSALVERHPGMSVPATERLTRTSIYIQVFADVYTMLLRRVRPRVVYLVCYYGSERFAMQLAARRLGVPTVDVQHGYSGELHWAYARWMNVPPGGFELLPRYFWCWSEEERRTIASWAERSGGAHRARVGGNLFARMWRDDDAEIVKRYDREVRGVVDANRPRVPVLYAANGLETEAQLRALAEVIRATRDELFWLVRLHPCRITDRARLETILRESGTAFDVERATSLPLYALLRNVELHVTESSTTVIEASEFGVPSVLWGALEAPSFAPYVASGWLRVAEDAGAVADELRRQGKRRDELRRSLAAGPRASDLDELLALAEREAGRPPEERDGDVQHR
ncbi:MAG: hypothetical protein KF782_15005 [Labilithrix sp.]|nr:hypothetical protein [Labilithrix sp.]